MICIKSAQRYLYLTLVAFTFFFSFSAQVHAGGGGGGSIDINLNASWDGSMIVIPAGENTIGITPLEKFAGAPVTVSWFSNVAECTASASVPTPGWTGLKATGTLATQAISGINSTRTLRLDCVENGSSVSYEKEVVIRNDIAEPDTSAPAQASEVSGSIAPPPAPPAPTPYCSWKQSQYYVETDGQCHHWHGQGQSTPRPTGSCDCSTQKGNTWKQRCDGGGGSWYGKAICTESIKPPYVDLEANGLDGPLTITQGTSVLLQWVAGQATNGCTASANPAVAGWSGAKNSTSGSQNLGALSAGAYRFTLTCSNASGNTANNVDVTINAPAVPDIAPIGNINFGPRTIGAGTGYYDEPITIVNNGGTDTIINVTGFSASSPYECFGPGCTNHTLSAGGGNVTVYIRYTPVAPAGPEAQETISVTCTGGCTEETFTVDGTAVSPPVCSVQGASVQYMGTGGNIGMSSFARVTAVPEFTTVSPNQVFDVDATGRCNGQDYAGNATVRGWLWDGSATNFPSTHTTWCGSTIQGSLGTVQITAPATPGTYCQEYYSAATFASGGVSPQPAVPGYFQYTVANLPTAHFSSPNAEFTDQNITIDYGDPVNLTWTSGGGATSCEITATNIGTGNVTNFWTGLAAGGTLTPAPTPNVDTRYSVTCENAGVWSTDSPDVIVTVNPPAPTITLEASVDGGATWSSADLTGVNAIDVGQQVDIRWIGNNANSCTTINLGGSTAVDTTPGGVAVTEPTGGSFTDYTVNCSGLTNPPDSQTIRVAANQQPDLISSVSIGNLVAQLDVDGNVTGNYSSVEVITLAREVGGADTGNSFDIHIEVDVDDNGGTPDAQHTFVNQPALSANSDGPSLSRIFTGLTMPVNPQSRITVTADPGDPGDVAESDNNNNTSTITFPNSLPPFTMELTLDPSDLVRREGYVDITYDTNAVFDMQCTLSGPALTTVTFNPSTDGATDTVTAGPLNSKSQYTLECEEQITGTFQLFTASASIETTSGIEEI